MEGIDLSALSGEELQQKVEEIVQQQVQVELEANRINEGEVTYAPPPAGNPVPPTGSQPSPSSQGKTPSFNDPSSVAHIVAQAAKATAETIAEQQGFARSGTLRAYVVYYAHDDGGYYEDYGDYDDGYYDDDGYHDAGDAHYAGGGDSYSYSSGELVERKGISVFHVPSPYRRADFLTKSLSKDAFESHRDFVMNLA
ncbi:unnamed protein product [Ectocarpus sp. CCAP 1310/34]|nr:unnamed protein product [Ectocarpus sp. CCAP 1310/34]